MLGDKKKIEEAAEEEEDEYEQEGFVPTFGTFEVVLKDFTYFSDGGTT
jgi:hypothetical protein